MSNASRIMSQLTLGQFANLTLHKINFALGEYTDLKRTTYLGKTTPSPRPPTANRPMGEFSSGPHCPLTKKCLEGKAVVCGGGGVKMSKGKIFPGGEFSGWGRGILALLDWCCQLVLPRAIYRSKFTPLSSDGVSA